MQAQELIDSVRRELVESGAAFWQDSELLDLVNAAERAINADVRFMEDKTQLYTVSGQQSYPLPDNWLSTHKVFYNDVRDGVNNWVTLEASNLEKRSQEDSNIFDTSSTNLGTPSKYWVWGNEIYLSPIPDTVSTILMFYKSKPISITSATEQINLDDSMSDGIRAYMLWKAWKKEKEAELALEAKAEYMEWVGKARRYMKKQANDQRRKIDIVSPSQFN